MTKLTYRQTFNIAEAAVLNLQQMGWVFRDGVIRAAALAALPQINVEAVISAIKDTLDAFRVSINPNWDGSIA